MENAEIFLRENMPLLVKSNINSKKFVNPFINNEALESVIKSLSNSIKQKMSEFKKENSLVVQEIYIEEETLPDNNASVIVFTKDFEKGVFSIFNKKNNCFFLENGNTILAYEVVSWKPR